jgi:hypothetical protein
VPNAATIAEGISIVLFHPIHTTKDVIAVSRVGADGAAPRVEAFARDIDRTVAIQRDGMDLIDPYRRAKEC